MSWNSSHWVLRGPSGWGGQNELVIRVDYCCLDVALRGFMSSNCPRQHLCMIFNASYRLSQDLALDVVHKFIEDEEAAARCFEATYLHVDAEILRSVLAGMTVAEASCTVACLLR